MTGESILFWVLAPLAVAASVAMLFMKKAVHSAILLAWVMITLAIFYIALEAPFLGIVQIGVGGDTVTCCDANEKIQVNGTSINEPYLYPGDKPSEVKFNVEIPEGFIWVMGDHRNASADSRFHPESANQGMVPLSKVVGRATFIVWPLGNISFIPKGEDLKKVPVKAK